ncbi:IclR family transcriptional regulator [Paenibacillus methanolicus]|uniref:DNA-binding IclR family transcriptional regulator n=1 Tax=Paenibacillus methanolicus TaxID=582686 RepID=A0A5S5CH09_9BACL|nr:IclR family transcriptional regulator [Paenibacillus methanolicus]TYP77516.1 DNA-binding IclR family transcriptional regulator [Paenibacillus methanolicus]
MSVISKAVRLLDFLLPQGIEKEVSADEIGRELDMPVHAAQRMLSSLCQEGFVLQDDGTKRFKLGRAQQAPGHRIWDTLMLRQTARPFVEALRRQTEETVYLAVYENQEGVFIDSIDSPHAVRVSEPVGLCLPLYIGASNRAILAHLPQRSREALLASVDWPDSPALKPLTREGIENDLERIRRLGYAVSTGEATEGTTGIAAPIFSYDNAVVGSLNCAGPSMRFTPELIERHSHHVRKYADIISKELGFRDLYRMNM